MVTLDSESELISRVLDSDDLTVGRGVSVGAVLNQRIVVLTDRLQETLLFGLDVVTGLIPEITVVTSSASLHHNQTITYIFTRMKYAKYQVCAHNSGIHTMQMYN